MTSFGRQALKKAQDIQDADRSHLTVGLRQLFDYSTFSSILAQFQHQFPNACVDVVPQDNRRPLEQLRSGQLDIGFSTPPSTPATGTSPLRPCSRWGTMC